MSKSRSAQTNNDAVAALLGELPVLLTVNEAARVLRISRRTFGRLLASKRIKVVRYTTGGSARVLIPRTSLETFVNANLD